MGNAFGIIFRIVRLLHRVVPAERGVSAVEFSLLAPFLVLGTFSTVDAGMAVYDKMMMTQVLRSGAQSAIAAKDEATVLSILQDTAAENFTVATGAPAPGELSLAVSSYCACGDALGVAIGCTGICTSGSAPHRFYDLDASMEFDGVILPTFTLSGDMAVLAQ